MSVQKSARALRVLICLLLLMPFASAQQPAAPGSSAGSTTPAPRRETVPVRPTFPQPTERQPQVQRPVQMVFVSGTVVREDGSEPPHGGVIEMQCGGLTTKEAVIGLNGRFSFQFGGENRYNQVIADASQGWDQYGLESDPMGGMGNASGNLSFPSMRQRNRRMLGCELKALIGGFHSTSISVNQEPQQGLNEIGTIVVYPASRVQGHMVSLTNLLAPKSARKSVEKGLKAVQKEKLSEAALLFQSAILEYPKYAEAWYYIGLIHESEGRKGEADGAYREAIAADALYMRPYLRLAHSASTNRNWREAADLSEKVISLDPVTRVEAYLMSSLAHLNLSELDLSEKRAVQGLKVDFSKSFPQLHLVLASVHSERRDIPGSVRELRDYLKAAPRASNASQVRLRLKQLEEAEKGLPIASRTPAAGEKE